MAERLSLLPALPLTQREADAMCWLASGKTDVAIATLLAISSRTVHKHLEQIERSVCGTRGRRQ
ncbi:LuxR C-terminal-related transcriptional regulator [Ramlibacter sp. AN1015]|uniref:LuxR C-terminal-related transcriptional regulator n=1 Tax=Ramlibacter sp. AN1015 TaxID=3133428 RepID=UPI0030C4C0D1